jgi:hypothetical protein
MPSVEQAAGDDLDLLYCLRTYVTTKPRATTKPAAQAIVSSPIPPNHAPNPKPLTLTMPAPASTGRIDAPAQAAAHTPTPTTAVFDIFI